MSSSRSGHLFPNVFYLRQSKSQMETLLTILNLVCQRFKANQLKRHKRWPSLMTAFVSILFSGPVIRPVSHSVGNCPLPLSPLAISRLSIYMYTRLCGASPAVLLILYIQISSLCTSGPRMRERTAVIFPNHGWLARQPTNPSAHGTTDPILLYI